MVLLLVHNWDEGVHPPIKNLKAKGATDLRKCKHLKGFCNRLVQDNCGHTIAFEKVSLYNWTEKGYPGYSSQDLLHEGGV